MSIFLQALLRAAGHSPGDATCISRLPRVWGELEGSRPARGNQTGPLEPLPSGAGLTSPGGGSALVTAGFWRIPSVVLVCTSLVNFSSPDGSRFDENFLVQWCLPEQTSLKFAA